MITIAWECLRTVVVDKAFGKYGVNPYIYFTLVMAIAVPYAIVTVRLLVSIVHRRLKQAFIYGVLSIVLHFVPDLYIILAAKEVPPALFHTFLFIVFLFAIFALQGIVVKVKRQRKLNSDDHKLV